MLTDDKYILCILHFFIIYRCYVGHTVETSTLNSTDEVTNNAKLSVLSLRKQKFIFYCRNINLHCSKSY